MYMYDQIESVHIYIYNQKERNTPLTLNKDTHAYDVFVHLTPVHIWFDGNYNTWVFHSSQTSK